MYSNAVSGLRDMLVKLYELPPLGPALERAHSQGIEVRLASPIERAPVGAWVRAFFGAWADEVDTSFTRDPVGCFVASRAEDGDLAGFACIDVVPGVFGPTAVREELRGSGIGTALLLASLHRLHAVGYAYAIIGGVGPAEYYEKVVGARLIEGSSMHGGLLMGVPPSVLAAREDGDG